MSAFFRIELDGLGYLLGLHVDQRDSIISDRSESVLRERQPLNRKLLFYLEDERERRLS